MNDIKYRAQAKGFSKVISLSCDLDRTNRDVKLNQTGGVTIEEIIAVRDGIAKELEVWNYIFKLIENDNKD